MRCIFCPRETDKQWAVTVEHLDGERERVIEPVCGRCNFHLDKAGSAGARLKATGERWFPGHIHGGSMKIDAPWMRDPKWPQESGTVTPSVENGDPDGSVHANDDYGE